MKIVLISDDNEFVENLRNKLVFLRNTDFVVVLKYADAMSSKEFEDAQIVLVQENPEFSTDLIVELRKKTNLCIILLANSYNREAILAFIDAGADDFILSSADDFEFVIRIINNIKRSSNIVTKRNEKLLKYLNVIDNGLYCKDYLKYLIDETTSYFVALSPTDNVKTDFSNANFAEVIKTSVRPQDVVFKSDDLIFYILLSQTDYSGVLVVLDRIKQKLNFDICAGVSYIQNLSCYEIEQNALRALDKAFATGVEFVFAEEKNETVSDEWLCDYQKNNYKFFRQIFNKKLEKVISPIFYRLQKSYEAKLDDTEIEQYTNNKECIFRLKSSISESFLKITYPGFAKIIIQIIHVGLDSPENREIQISLSKFTQKELIAIIENFIKEYKESKC